MLKLTRLAYATTRTIDFSQLFFMYYYIISQYWPLQPSFTSYELAVQKLAVKRKRKFASVWTLTGKTADENCATGESNDLVALTSV